jgi:hypothetical protein
MGYLHQDIRPPEPGVYPVLALAVDHKAGESVWIERFAKWTGEYWTAWADTPERAARCSWACGPLGGYRWRYA